jgi:hypothetical protein
VKRRLEYKPHNESSTYKWKPLTGRPAGRPKSRWEDDIRNDMKRMQIVKWTEHVQDRPKWKVIVEKAKTLPEL